MPRITGSLALLHLNDKALLAALDKELKAILVEGTQEWVRTVAAILPTWSGEMLSSLKPIADLVDVPIFVSPVPQAPDRTAKGEREGKGELISKSGRYLFHWETNVFHFFYNENFDMTQHGFRLITPTPYHSQRQARKAFFRTVNPRLRSLRLNINTYLRVQNKVL